MNDEQKIWLGGIWTSKVLIAEVPQPIDEVYVIQEVEREFADFPLPHREKIAGLVLRMMEEHARS